MFEAKKTSVVGVWPRTQIDNHSGRIHHPLIYRTKEVKVIGSGGHESHTEEPFGR